jgi:hypothetical protein
MKKNSLRKTFSFLAALAVAGSVMTSSINPAHAKTISSHKSILVGQTITVKVKKGKKQKSSNRSIATVSKKYTKKRKKVTVRRKGKKIRKWKKVKVPNGKFAIRGIRAGKATITIRSGKKTYKFKVTVKNRPVSKSSSSSKPSKPSASSSSSSHSSGSATTNPRPAGMTGPNGPAVSDFYIHKMAGQNEFYNTLEETGEGSTVIIHWKTNLKSKDFILYNETTNKPMLDNAGIKTNDGYTFSVSEEKPGTYRYSVAVSGEENDYRIEKIGYTLPFKVTFKDYKTAENQALDALISRSGAASEKTVKEKLVTLARYMANTGWENGSFIHPGKAHPDEYADTHGDYGVWFQSRVINCVKATAIIEKCASIFGVPDNGISEEYPYPADSPYAHHVRPVITYDGETFPVDGSPWTHIKPYTE